MATRILTTFGGSITDAYFRAFGGFVENLLIAGGWVKVLEQYADGAVSMATVVPVSVGAPPATFAWQVWRMDDVLQSTAPCFIRLRFYRDGNANSHMGIGMQVGTGPGATASNALNLLIVDTEIVGSGSSATGLPGSPFYANDASEVLYGSADSGRFILMHTDSVHGTHRALCLERRTTPSGQPSASGFNISFKVRDNQGAWSRMTTATAGFAEKRTCAIASSTAAENVQGADTHVGPLVNFSALPMEASRQLLYVPNTFVDQQEFMPQVFGVARNFRVINSSPGNSNMWGPNLRLLGGGGDGAVAILWE